MIVMGFMGIFYLAFICALLEFLVPDNASLPEYLLPALRNEMAMNQLLCLQHL